MNLISCDGCGRVYDKIHIPFPDMQAAYVCNVGYEKSRVDWNPTINKLDVFVKCECGNQIFKHGEEDVAN